MGSLWPRINVSLQAVAQILLVIMLGVWLTVGRGFDRKALAAVSGVNWHVLIPALMFSSIVGAVTPSGLVLLWPLLLLSVIHVVLGLIPALLLVWVTRLPKDIGFFTVMASSMPNCGNLPWLFMPTIIRYYTPADQVAAQVQYSTGLTSVYTISIILITLTVPFLFKRPPDTIVLPRSRSHAEELHAEVPEGQQPQAARAQPQHEQQLQPPSAQQQQQQQPSGQQSAWRHDQQDNLQQQAAGHAANGNACTAWVVTGLDPFTEALHKSDQHSCPVSSKDVLDAAGRQQDSNFVPQQSRWTLSPHMLGHYKAQPSGQQQQQPPAAAAGALPRDPDNTNTASSSMVSSFEVMQEEDEAEDGLHRNLPPAARQPYVGVSAADSSFVSHRSNSFLLQHSRRLLGSFRGSFSRGLRRSASFVQLVWSFPTGWQPQRQDAQRHQHSCRGPPWLQRVWSAWQSLLAHPVVNLPLGATLVGIACAAVGPVRKLLVDELAPLHWLWLGLGWVGAAAAPLATMQIGAELKQAPSATSVPLPCHVQWTGTAIAIVVKLVVVPFLNIVLLRFAGFGNLVPASDSVYQLLMLVEASVPAAVTLLVVCERVYPDSLSPLSGMLFWQYVASLVTLPAFLVWYLYMLEL